MVDNGIPEFEEILTGLATLVLVIGQRFQKFWSKVAGYLQSALPLLVKQPVISVSAIVTGLLLGGQALGWLQPWELVTYDRRVRWLANQGPDPRLLIVGITEDDIQAQQRWPLSDQTIAALIEQLQQHQPAVIGLDIFRDLPQDPGNDQLTYQLKAANVIGITKLGTEDDRGVPPPPNLPAERIGFNDVVLDPDAVIRRNLMLGSTSDGEVFSFSFQIVRQYLTQRAILPKFDPQNPARLRWGAAVFDALSPTAGGYQAIDAGGYQILLRYRSNRDVARQVTLSQVLQGEIDPAWVRGKVVLIGATAASSRDVFLTPYSPAERSTAKMPGIQIHAQMVSQLLTAIEDGSAVFWFWPDWVEGVWLLTWSMVGSVLAWRIQHPLKLALTGGLGALGIVCISLWAYAQAGWIPVAGPMLALLMSGGGVLAYTNYQIKQEQAAIAAQAIEQEKTIALLRTMLVESSLTVASKTAPSARPDGSVYKPKGDITLPGPTLLPVDDLPSILDPSLDFKPTSLNPASQSDTVLPDETTDHDDETVVLPEGVSFGSPPSTHPTLPETTSPLLPKRQRDIEHSNTLLAQRYKINRVLGSGGFGMTYLAEDIQRPGNPICVVKRLMPARTDDRFMKTARRLFKTEAEILEKLGRHDQIPQLLAAFEEEEEFYLVEDFIPGDPLTMVLRNDKPLPEPEVIAILKGVLDVLEFIHARHVIHRDLKPGNLIRRDPDHQLVLIDFGAVKQIRPQSQEDELATIAIGTRGYAPAEQLAGYPTLNSDLYALGVICVQALTGKPPHLLDADTVTANLIWRHLADVSAPLADILDKMVCYYFNDRYQSATDVLRDLKPLLSSQ